MRVCMITTVHDIMRDSRVFHKMAYSLALAGHHVTFMAPYNERAVVDGVHIWPLPRVQRRVRRLLLQRTVYAAAKEIDADIYHLHDPELLLTGWLLGRSGRAVVMDFHENVRADLQLKHYLAPLLRPVAPLVYAAAERLLLTGVAGVILAEDSYLPTYERVERKVVIHNYPMVDGVPPRASHCPRPNQPVELVYAGTISRSRGTFDLVEALRLLQATRNGGARLHLMGPENDETEARALRARIRASGVETACMLYGSRPYPEVFRLLGSCHVGLAVLQDTGNYRGSLPTKLLEYMLVGLPVIASDFPVNRTYVSEPGTRLLVEPGRPEAIAEAVSTLVSDPELFGRMSRRGYSLVRHRFSWELEAKRLEEFYQACAKA
jgi:glycosyltransferase involved in cell wall biosynthesis